MSKQIDITKPLSDDDRAYLQMMGRNDLIERADSISGGGSSSASTAGPTVPADADPQKLLEDTPNTGDVNTGVQKRATPTQAEVDARVASVAAELEDKYTKDELEAAAEKRDLSKSGNKSALARRLAEHLINTGELDDADADEDEEDDGDEDDGNQP